MNVDFARGEVMLASWSCLKRLSIVIFHDAHCSNRQSPGRADHRRFSLSIEVCLFTELTGYGLVACQAFSTHFIRRCHDGRFEVMVNGNHIFRYVGIQRSSQFESHAPSGTSSVEIIFSLMSATSVFPRVQGSPGCNNHEDAIRLFHRGRWCHDDAGGGPAKYQWPGGRQGRFRYRLICWDNRAYCMSPGRDAFGIS